MNRFIGIDPGIDGGICFLIEGMISAEITPTIFSGKTKKGGNRRDFDMEKMASMLGGDPPSLLVIEAVHGVAGGKFSTMGGRAQGMSSIFNFGRGYGIWLGIIAALRLPHEVVAPRTWKAAILAGTAKDKAAAAMFARRRFPRLSLKATPRCKVDHDGIADAVCLAEFARRQLSGRTHEVIVS